MLTILFFSLGNERTKLFLKCKQLECKSLVSQKGTWFKKSKSVTDVHSDDKKA